VRLNRRALLGVQKLLVVLVDFNDTAGNTLQVNWDDFFFNIGGVDLYYSTISNGKVTFPRSAGTVQGMTGVLLVIITYWYYRKAQLYGMCIRGIVNYIVSTTVTIRNVGTPS